MKKIFNILYLIVIFYINQILTVNIIKGPIQYIQPSKLSQLSRQEELLIKKYKYKKIYKKKAQGYIKNQNSGFFFYYYLLGKNWQNPRTSFNNQSSNANNSSTHNYYHKNETHKNETPKLSEFINSLLEQQEANQAENYINKQLFWDNKLFKIKFSLKNNVFNNIPLEKISQLEDNQKLKLRNDCLSFFHIPLQSTKIICQLIDNNKLSIPPKDYQQTIKSLISKISDTNNNEYKDINNLTGDENTINNAVKGIYDNMNIIGTTQYKEIDPDNRIIIKKQKIFIFNNTSNNNQNNPQDQDAITIKEDIKKKLLIEILKGTKEYYELLEKQRKKKNEEHIEKLKESPYLGIRESTFSVDNHSKIRENVLMILTVMINNDLLIMPRNKEDINETYIENIEDLLTNNNNIENPYDQKNDDHGTFLQYLKQYIEHYFLLIQEQKKDNIIKYKEYLDQEKINKNDKNTKKSFDLAKTQEIEEANALKKKQYFKTKTKNNEFLYQLGLLKKSNSNEIQQAQKIEKYTIIFNNNHNNKDEIENTYPIIKKINNKLYQLDNIYNYINNKEEKIKLLEGTNKIKVEKAIANINNIREENIHKFIQEAILNAINLAIEYNNKANEQHYEIYDLSSILTNLANTTETNDLISNIERDLNKHHKTIVDILTDATTNATQASSDI